MSTQVTATTMIMGEVGSLGIAKGRAFVCTCAEQAAIPRRTISDRDTQSEMKRFDVAVEQAEEELVRLQEDVHRQIGMREAEILQVHISLLHDSTLREEVRQRCVTERINVEAALDEAIDNLIAVFTQAEGAYLRERAADLRDVRTRLLDTLAGRRQGSLLDVPDGSIVVTSELLPSVIPQLLNTALRGLVLEQGGQTAHATIMIRALGIPLLMNVRDATKRIHTNDLLIIDGLAGRVFINPSATILKEYEKQEAGFKAHQEALQGLTDLPAVTQDGVRIKLCGNVGKVADATAIASMNADGVGLYRTEFVFLVEDHFPSEEEQYLLYRATADYVKPRYVVIRLLDIGSDKLLPYFPLPREGNPSLGSRGIRLLLKYPDILKAQLRAILRLSATHPVSVLVPMVGDMEELHAAKTIIDGVKSQLRTEGRPFNRNIAVGAMIETPSAAIMASRLAQHVDFLSVGTNDLIQYLLAADRMSSELASYYQPLHPAVLQVLQSLVTAAHAANKEISICGEMAGNPTYTQLLLGLGYRSLSVNSGDMLEVKDVIRSTNVQQAASLAQRVLELNTVREIQECLRRYGCAPTALQA